MRVILGLAFSLFCIAALAGEPGPAQKVSSSDPVPYVGAEFAPGAVGAFVGLRRPSWAVQMGCTLREDTSEQTIRQTETVSVRSKKKHGKPTQQSITTYQTAFVEGEVRRCGVEGMSFLGNIRALRFFVAAGIWDSARSGGGDEALLPSLGFGAEFSATRHVSFRLLARQIGTTSADLGESTLALQTLWNF